MVKCTELHRSRVGFASLLIQTHCTLFNTTAKASARQLNLGPVTKAHEHNVGRSKVIKSLGKVTEQH